VQQVILFRTYVSLLAGAAELKSEVTS
jgi:hypothetical protein